MWIEVRDKRVQFWMWKAEISLRHPYGNRMYSWAWGLGRSSGYIGKYELHQRLDERELVRTKKICKN